LIIALDWVARAIILALLGLGWIMVYRSLDSAATFDNYQWHKSFGFTALALTALRLVVRVLSSSPAIPASAPREQRLAALTQASLDVLTSCAIISGWVVVSTSPLPVPNRFFDLFVIPNITRSTHRFSPTLRVRTTSSRGASRS
jgi:cytochrome b561